MFGFGKKRNEDAYLTNEGIACRKRGEVDKALELHFKALEIRVEKNDDFKIGCSQENIGNCYRDKGELEKADSYYIASEESFSKSDVKAKDWANLSYSHAKCLMEMKAYQRSEDMFISACNYYLEFLDAESDEVLNCYKGLANCYYALGKEEKYYAIKEVIDYLDNPESSTDLKGKVKTTVDSIIFDQSDDSS